MNTGKKRKVDYIRSRKTPCVACGYFDHPDAIDFHHVHDEDKSFGLSCKGASRSYEKIDLEIAKCVCLCANCHRLHHAGVIPKSEIVFLWWQK